MERKKGRWRFTGLILGLLLSLAIGRFLTTMLYGISPRDPMVIGIVVIVISVVALIASGVPGVRSAFIDPAAALRIE